MTLMIMDENLYTQEHPDEVFLGERFLEIDVLIILHRLAMPTLLLPLGEIEPIFWQQLNLDRFSVLDLPWSWQVVIEERWRGEPCR